MVSQLTDEKRALVSDAVREAEKKTSGEIIPVVVARASRYPGAVVWLSMVLCLALVAVSWLLFQRFRIIELGWDQQVVPQYGLFWILATIGFAFVAAGVVARFAPGLLRVFVSAEEASIAAQRVAAEAFYRFRLTRTRARTAVLICVCVFERRVVVLGDVAISERLTQSDWDGVRDAVLSGIERGDLATGLVAGIESAGELLSRNFPSDLENPDEVTNELRVLA